VVPSFKKINVYDHSFATLVKILIDPKKALGIIDELVNNFQIYVSTLCASSTGLYFAYKFYVEGEVVGSKIIRCA